MPANASAWTVLGVLVRDTGESSRLSQLKCESFDQLAVVIIRANGGPQVTTAKALVIRAVAKDNPMIADEAFPNLLRLN
jgi:ribosomal protein L14